MEVSSKIKVVFAGSPHVSAKILENLILNKDFDLKLVISQPPKRKKRGALIEDTEVTKVAKKNNVSVINPERVDHEVKKILDEIEFDILQSQSKNIFLKDKNEIIAIGVIIKIDPGYFRPTEIYELRGDARKAKRELKWKPKTTFKSMVKEMVLEDIKKQSIFPLKQI